MKQYVSRDIFDVFELISHNTDVTEKRFRKLNNKMGRFMIAGIIFGVFTEFRFTMLNQNLALLYEKICEMNTEIKELRGKEGD